MVSGYYTLPAAELVKDNGEVNIPVFKEIPKNKAVFVESLILYENEERNAYMQFDTFLLVPYRLEGFGNIWGGFVYGVDHEGNYHPLIIGVSESGDVVVNLVV